jgi:hypothetical protein
LELVPFVQRLLHCFEYKHAGLVLLVGQYLVFHRMYRFYDAFAKKEK